MASSDRFQSVAEAIILGSVAGGWPYLWLDATEVRVCESGRIVSDAVND